MRRGSRRQSRKRRALRGKRRDTDDIRPRQARVIRDAQVFIDDGHVPVARRQTRDRHEPQGLPHAVLTPTLPRGHADQGVGGVDQVQARDRSFPSLQSGSVRVAAGAISGAAAGRDPLLRNARQKKCRHGPTLPKRLTMSAYSYPGPRGTGRAVPYLVFRPEVNCGPALMTRRHTLFRL